MPRLVREPQPPVSLEKAERNLQESLTALAGARLSLLYAETHLQGVVLPWSTGGHECGSRDL